MLKLKIIVTLVQLSVGHVTAEPQKNEFQPYQLPFLSLIMLICIRSIFIGCLKFSWNQVINKRERHDMT